MHWILKALLTVLGNAFALWLANLFIPGFVVQATVLQLLLVALVLALLNWVLKPILTLLFGPLIILTLGIGVLIVNAVILLLLPWLTNHIDFLRESVNIQNIPALILATVLVSIVNLMVHVIE
ncbi:MAG: phage holin family protein [Patescibacteria group bacterium]|nr:phage holin family protein [Patescibacteria group bacterium]